jgi:hypothetical protein
MTFQIHPLPAADFTYLSELSADELATRNIQVHVSDGAFPCRVSLADRPAGERVYLLHYEHQPNETPYRASHAIFVAENAREGRPDPDTLPASISSRLLSVRAFNEAHEIVDAEIVEGTEAAGFIENMLGNPSVDYIHLHYARRGCFAAEVRRA